MMGNPKYNSGDLLGPYKTLLLKRTIKESSGSWKGLMICSFCGKQFESRISSVVSGRVKSCGCENQRQRKINGSKTGRTNGQKSAYKRIVDLSKETFGLLHPIEAIGINDNGHAIWLCYCECGKKVKVCNSDLRSGRVLSCGCLKQSYNEYMIEQIFIKNKINYQTQYSFQDCRNPKTNALLRFDFYLPDYNCCIEYDGEQHFFCTGYGWNTADKFKQLQYRDSIKNQYCKDNDIKLIRIPYTDKDKINDIYILSLIAPTEDVM